jgi:GNAT superfamily N-acetyltransferase
MQISYLADHPEFVPTLARWLLEQWRSITLEQTLESRTAKLQMHLNRDVLPIAWVAHVEQEPLGTAALRVHDLEGREDLTPWLGGVYVAPQHRRRGIGAALCGSVEEKARKLGYEEIYLFTLDRQIWYASLGWGAPEPTTWRGHPGVIMRKHLRPSA